jgi:DNA modification methylase
MLRAKWGQIPGSIFKVDWSRSKNIDLTERSYSQQQEEAGIKGTPFELSSVGARHGGLSRFPQDVGTFLVNFLCPENGIVLDPFAGHNSRCELVWRSGRNYIGFDVSHEFMEANHKIKDMIYAENEASIIKNDAKINLIEIDSRNIMDYASKESADFILTSPPFFDLEYYGPEPEQLGNAKLYTDFLYALQAVFANCFAVLKSGCFAAIEVNDFRSDGVFYAYHADTIDRLRRVGFTIHDIIIVDYGSSFLRAFATDIEAYKIVGKQHSYMIVARKPAVKKDANRYQVRETLLVETEQVGVISDVRQTEFDLGGLL